MKKNNTDDLLKPDTLSELLLSKAVTINDLREKEYNGERLSVTEKKALAAFDSFRLSALNQIETEEAFHKKYMDLQVLANLSPFEEFLQEKYRVKNTESKDRTSTE